MFPPFSWTDIDAYDHDEVVEGYRSYKRGDLVPGPNHSDGFRWGWQNGFYDHNYLDGDDGYCAIRYAYIRESRKVRAA